MSSSGYTSTIRKLTGQISLRSWKERSSTSLQCQATMTGPLGCKEQYIPGIFKESSELYEEYVTMFNDDPYSDSTNQVGEKVMESISQEPRKSW